MKLKITTETGSYYEIEYQENGTKRWSKNGGNKDRLVMLKSGLYEDHVNKHSWNDVIIPELDQSMFIHGRGFSNWFVTTHVVRIEVEYDDGSEEIREGKENNE